MGGNAAADEKMMQKDAQHNETKNYPDKSELQVQ